MGSGEPVARAGKPVTVRIPCAGLDPGSSVTVKVFELHGLGGDPIETLQATVGDDGLLASVQWTYDYDKYKDKVASSKFIFICEANGRTTASAPHQFLDTFKATVKDASGNPAAHRLVVLHADRGENVQAVTDGTGRVKALVPPGAYHVELLGPAPPEMRIPDPPSSEGPEADEPVEHAADATDGAATETPAAPGCVRAHLGGMHFDTDKTFLLPSAIPFVQGFARFQEAHQGDQVLIVGHTDTVGSPSYNMPLSNERALVVQAYLTNDADTWQQRFDAAQPAGKRWGALEVEHMLSALPEDQDTKFYSGTPDGNRWSQKHRDAVSAFQTSAGIAANGDDTTGGTRLALIQAYQAIQHTTLAAGTTVEVLACGENHPIENPGVDNFASETNRRVELFLWDKGQTIDPPADDCRNATHPGCTAYDAWVACIHHEITGDEADADEVTLLDDAGEPLASVNLTESDGSPATTDDQGHTAVTGGAGASIKADGTLATAIQAKPFDRPFKTQASGEQWVTVAQMLAGVSLDGSATVVVKARVSVTIDARPNRTEQFRVQKSDGTAVTDGVTITTTRCVVHALALGDGTVLQVLTKDYRGQDFVVSSLDLDAIAAGAQPAIAWPPDAPAGPRPFWIVGHNPNTYDQVDKALQSGANALEPDVNVYEDDETRLCVSHGEGEFAAPTINDFLRHLHRAAIEHPQLSLIVFDCKSPAAKPHFGRELLDKIRQYLTHDIPMNIIISVGSRDDRAMFDEIQHDLREREGLMIDGEDDPGAIGQFFRDRGVANQGYGNGISIVNSVLGPSVRPSMEKACELRARTNEPRFIYVWTVDEDDLQEEYIKIGVDGIIADYETDLTMFHAGNQLRKLRQIVDSGRYANLIRLATRDDNPMTPPNQAYALTVHTGDVSHAGTDANVTITLTGANGSASVTIDTSYHDRMERNDTNQITLQSRDLGPLQSISVSRDDSGNAPDWFLDRIWIRSFKYGGAKVAVFNQWIETGPPVTKPLADG